MIRVVWAEDNALLRDGVGRLLAARDDVELLGVAKDLETLLALVDDVRPDVVVTDIRMPPSGTDEGVRAAAALRQSHPDIGVVVLSQHASPSYAVALLEDGAARRGYLLKERVEDIEDLVRAVKEVHAGGSVIDPQVVELLVSARRSGGSDIDRLTPREREILAEMATGKSNAAIARTFVLSEGAVEKHTNSIFAKLGLGEQKDVNRRVTAVLLYLSARSAG